MQTILNSVRPVIGNSKHVKINREVLEAFAASVKPEDMEGAEYAEEAGDFTQEQHVAFAFVYNSLNFCYWGEPKWAVTIDGEQYDGSAAMWRSLQKAIASGYELLSAKYLRNLPEADLAKILSGNIQIPLFSERLRLLRKLGEVIDDKYGGSFASFVDTADWDAVKLVELLAADIPDVFNDEVDYHGNTVKFYKRAQLVPAHLWDLHRFGTIPQKINNFDQLTAFADYKVPQLLRKFKILEYTPDLANKVDNLVEISAGSDEEIEIRAATIWAIELTTQAVKQRVPSANAAKVDGIFWFKGQEKSPDDKPYHRSRTIWY